MVSHSAPALVLTQSPRDLLPPLKDMPHMPTLATVDITMANVMLMPMLRFWLPVTHMPPPMVLSPMLWLPPPLVLSTNKNKMDSAPSNWKEKYDIKCRLIKPLVLLLLQLKIYRPIPLRCQLDLQF